MSDSSLDRDPLVRLAEECVARLRAGQRAALTEYADRHPDLAEQIRELVPALVEMEQLKPTTGEHTGAFTPAAEPSDPVRVGEFRILRRVGRGGMGVVFEAVQESLGRHVALKLLPSESVADPKRLERFRREARAAARLHHTNIVPVFGVGEADGRHFYAMQFIGGHPLDAVIEEVKSLKAKSVVLPSAPRAVSQVAAGLRTGAFATASRERERPELRPEELPATELRPESDSAPALSGSLSEGGRGYWETVARMGAQVADALAYAHAQGILHRDIKPANLLLDLRGTVWVMDFGLAKSADADDLTHAGDIVGTLRYMAPERFDGAGDARSDVYALGLTLYELLTLRPAFRAENRAKLVEQVLAASPPKPRSVNAAIPRDLETIVLKAIARDPAARYPNAEGLADDLGRFLDGRTITARRVSTAERLWRWAKRAPTVAALLVTTLVLLAAGTALSTFFAVRADGERRNALDRQRDAEHARRDADARADDLRIQQAETRQLLYVSQVNRASTAAAEYRTTRLEELLADTTPKPGEPDPRGWEWHYLDRLAHSWDTEVKLDANAVPGSTADLEGHLPRIHGAQFTADGSRLVVLPLSSTMRMGIGGGQFQGDDTRSLPGAVFDTVTGRVLQPIKQTDLLLPGRATGISPDGRFLTFVEAPGGSETLPPGAGLPVKKMRVRVTDVSSGQEAAPPLECPFFPLEIAVSSGASRVTVVQGSPVRPAGLAQKPDEVIDPQVVIWERGREGTRTRTLRPAEPGQKRNPYRRSVNLSPDGATAVVVCAQAPQGPMSGSWGNVLEVHELLGPDGPPRVFDSAAGFESPRFSAGGTVLALAEARENRTVRVLDVRSGQWLGRWTVPPEVPLSSDASATGTFTVVVSDDGRRVVVDAGNGLLVVGEPAGAPHPHDAGTERERWRTAVLRSSESRDRALWLAPDGSRLVVAANDALRTWTLTPLPGYGATWPDEIAIDGAVCRGMPFPHGRRVLYYTGNSTPGANPAADRPLAVYDPIAGRIVWQFKIKSDFFPVGLSPRLSPVPGADQ